jgi:hypothetical protein
LCPDDQLCSDYDPTPPIVIEVACSQKFNGPRGLKWKLCHEIVDSAGRIKVGLGLKIDIEKPAWNPCLTLYRPDHSPLQAGTGGTVSVQVELEQEQLTGPNASQGSFILTLRDFISGENPQDILDQFPGLQDELDLPVPIMFADVSAAIAVEKLKLDVKNRKRKFIGTSPTSAPNITKKHHNIRDPNSASDPESSEADDAAPGPAAGDELVVSE